MFYLGSTHISLVGYNALVNIGDSSSETISVQFGVPQGSVLGHCLFNIHIRSLYKHVANMGFNIEGFADDYQVYRSFSPVFQLNVLT